MKQSRCTGGVWHRVFGSGWSSPEVIDAVKSIKTQRDAAWSEYIGRKSRYSDKKGKLKRLEMKAYIQVDFPTVGEVQGSRAYVLLEKPVNSLSIEAVPENINYFAAVSKANAVGDVDAENNIDENVNDEGGDDQSNGESDAAAE